MPQGNDKTVKKKIDIQQILENIIAFFQPKNADAEQVRHRNNKSRVFFVSFKTVIAVFAAAVVLISSVSIMTVIKERRKPKSDDQNNTVAESELVAAVPDSYLQNSDFGGSNILVALTRSENEGLHFLAVIHADGESGNLGISYIPTDTVNLVRGNKADMAGHLADGGITELVWAVGEEYSIAIDRYICCDNENFAKMIKRIGNVDLAVEEEVRYEHNGINFIINAGPQSLTADTLLKYLVYLTETVDKNAQKLANVLGVIARQMLVGEDEHSTPEEMYPRLVNYVTTDITPVDVSGVSPILQSLALSGVLDTIEVKENCEGFCVTNDEEE